MTHNHEKTHQAMILHLATRLHLILLSALVALPVLITGCGGGSSQDPKAEKLLPVGPPPEMSPAPPTFEEYGYQARSCGFDLDDDGIVGEPEDDCNLCDGTTTDPDGDGVDEDLVYVSCGGGSDAFGCGTPQSPCNSIGYAWANVVDGPDDGAEDIVCFSGTCKEEKLHPAFGGLAATRVAIATGSEGRDWEVSLDPAMLVGWDTDDDGEYPPADRDETAILDGSGGLSRAFELGDGQSHLEMAHFTVKDYGRFSKKEDSGWLRFTPQGNSLSHLYFHDQELLAVNMDRPAGRSVSAIHFTTKTLRLHWFHFNNLLLRDNGGSFAVGAGPGEAPDFGPFRWQDITRTAHSCDFGQCGNDASTLDFAFSGYISGFEILDSVWFSNVSHWQPGGAFGAAFVAAAQYTQDWLVRGNLVIDHKSGLIVRGGAAANYAGTIPRPVDGVIFDRNMFLNTYSDWQYGDVAIDLRGGEEREELVGSVYVTNNVLATLSPWDACIWMKVGNDYREAPGEIVLVGNTCSGPISRYGAILIGNHGGKDFAYPQQHVTLRNNIISGVGSGNPNLLATYRPKNWDADGNVYDPEGYFRWRGTSTLDLEEFRTMAEAEANSTTCTPTFRQPGRDYHLKSTDTCARDAGVEIPLHEIPQLRFELDLDQDPRGQDGGWDVGADEATARSESADTDTADTDTADTSSESRTTSK
jgi:hypothetical protein